MESSITSSAGNGEEVKSYRIHVSSKYLELTQKKLELTRLPHELLLPKGREWEDGTPKGDIEPLIDFWLEQYSWRDQEEKLNALPQFRTAIQPEQGAPLRIHFIHVRSPHAHAIPLLLIPPFPLTNLSLSKLIEPLSKPEDPITNQPFHLVIPSIPGLGFSDPLTAIDGRNTGLLETAGVFNKLMLRLGYQCYIATATAGGRESPAGIDYHLARLIGETFKENCLGVHLINPLLERPRLSREPLGWIKLSVAKFFHAEIFGYEAQDFAALKASEIAAKSKKRAQTAAERAGERKPLLKDKLASGVVASVGLREPNTLAYALCDSPVGLLSLVCSTLKRLSPKHALGETEIINLTQQAWLPGPEAAIRFWAGALNEVDNFSSKKSKSSVAVTIFGDAGDEGYMCPAWASGKHDVIFTQRVNGSAGLIVLEKPEIVVDGVRGLAKEVQKNDARIKAHPLDEVVVDRPDQTIPEEDEVGGESVLQLDVESPDTIVAGER